ncbi:MAG: hypothetical protein HN742_15965 [Lentisphaerae bacterium]|nr:hypothetical protein [Lentisphaerota bacterium]MBT4820111.1 hypothetical protein [Lentisphaerota bacterium]MBT5609001.1 hypothetical protein [Lentisphaerota bacterium]MBT7055822.1 hypothetical protein [Lentisphaerota bacterium]MBT7843373.1 hypothetical protein [Lentisphaerota bacterium]
MPVQAVEHPHIRNGGNQVYSDFDSLVLALDFCIGYLHAWFVAFWLCTWMVHRRRGMTIIDVLTRTWVVRARS